MKFKMVKIMKILYKVFNDKIKIKNNSLWLLVEMNISEKHPNIMATRFDYLRIAKAMMDDYQNEMCWKIFKRNL